MTLTIYFKGDHTTQTNEEESRGYRRRNILLVCFFGRLTHTPIIIGVVVTSEVVLISQVLQRKLRKTTLKMKQSIILMLRIKKIHIN